MNQQDAHHLGPELLTEELWFDRVDDLRDQQAVIVFVTCGVEIGGELIDALLASNSNLIGLIKVQWLVAIRDLEVANNCARYRSM